jgi:hypothetical protein
MNARITTRDFAGSAPPREGGFWSRYLNRVRSWFQIPYGYQDETGFHYGIQPPPQQVRPETTFRPGQTNDCAGHAMKHPVAIPLEVQPVATSETPPVAH